jgi:excisionase family DNA binding protein
MRSPLRRDKIAQDSRRFYSVAEVAQMFGMAQMTLYRAIHDGQFPAVKIRGRYVIPALALDAMEEAAVSTRAVVVAGDWAPDGAA